MKVMLADLLVGNFTKNFENCLPFAFRNYKKMHRLWDDNHPVDF